MNGDVDAVEVAHYHNTISFQRRKTTGISKDYGILIVIETGLSVPIGLKGKPA